MDNVKADFDFLYLGTRANGDEVFTRLNLAESETQVSFTADKVEVDGPSLCNYDQIYNGIECVTEYK